MIRRLYARMGREGLEAWEVFDRRWTERLGEVEVGMGRGARERVVGMSAGRTRERAGEQDGSGVVGGADGGGEGRGGAAGAGRSGR